VHPTQLYSSVNAFLLVGILYALWRKFRLLRPGAAAGLMLILYGAARFVLEIFRDDNPFEYSWWAIYKGGTISQNLGIYMAAIGAAVFLFCLWKSKPVTIKKTKNVVRKPQKHSVSESSQSSEITEKAEIQPEPAANKPLKSRSASKRLSN
jgi:prolipoprotein diacylglyceryltransferase